MSDSSDSARSRKIESVQSGRGSGAVRRAMVLLAGLTLGFACVDLTPPPEVVQYRNGLSSGGGVGNNGGDGDGGIRDTGGSLGTGGAGGDGATDAGGAVGVGGKTSAGGGGATGAGGAVGVGGKTGAGGSTIPTDARGVAGTDGSAIPDIVLGSGGAVGTGGSVGQDGAAHPGTGGRNMDASPGKGGATPDAPIGTGGVAGSGGLVSTGGAVGTGGTTAGTGGATVTGGATGSGGATEAGGATGYSCANAIVPASGVVTDFSDWDATTSRWGSGTLTGNIYQYAGSGATMNTAQVEGTPKGLHLTGKVPSIGYGGGGLTFLSCTTVASFTKVQFDVYGSAPNCAVELQLQTFDQRPTDQSPPGGCLLTDAGSGCFTFPVMKQVVSLSTAVAAPGRTVSATLASLTNWSTSAAGQIVGLQWQFTRGSSSSDCTVDATFTNIKFVP